jgi:hypothetical protein
MVLLGDEAQMEADFGPFGDSANFDPRLAHGCVERTIGSEIFLDTLDGTPRRCGSCGILFRSVWRWC